MDRVITEEADRIISQVLEGKWDGLTEKLRERRAAKKPIKQSLAQTVKNHKISR